MYGDPPRARVDAGRLVHLGGESAPRRGARARPGDGAPRRAGLVPGRRVLVGGRDADRLIDGIQRARMGPSPARSAASARPCSCPACSTA
ncbi:MAG: hypothetical protein MZU84_00795 [Sphingobacterium sp.]|nr:hypothetical protein [Sphingobacterium sp.]